MGKNIAWLSFVLIFVLAANLYRKQSFDQAARNVAAEGQIKIERIENSTKAMDEKSLKEIAELIRKIKTREQNPLLPY